ncbi:metallo-phosphoesterase [Sorangium cellulosum]|uniref:Metallo-phosphoesterase n=1 Tax=Sorangium cellulosum TaxID=56 RepID=A0A150RT06_SORCE|nr:metallo-phosphoesterase [Sorangium cellulosum]KYG01639.1 metallo-phosphoesterase [Sorangium cellulosum]
MRIAHLSDLHLLSLEGAIPFRLLNKRLTGYINLRFRRRAIHKPHAVHAAAKEIRRLGIDHVVITGDVSNLALEREFVLVRSFLQRDLGLPPERVSIVPGNHDAYTKGAHRSQRFSQYFAPYLRSDLPLDDAAKRDDGAGGSDGGGSAFPFVHLRGPVAFIGLSTAWPRPPLVASGRLGPAQLRALERVLSHPEVRRRTPIVLQHHPFHNPASRAKTLLEGLGDAAAEGRLLRHVSRGLLLHGHLHRRIHRKLHTERGHIDAVGAASASLLHESDERMAGFNVYEVDDAGAIRGITSHRFVPGQEAFREVPVPER